MAYLGLCLRGFWEKRGRKELIGKYAPAESCIGFYMPSAPELHCVTIEPLETSSDPCSMFSYIQHQFSIRLMFMSPGFSQLTLTEMGDS